MMLVSYAIAIKLYCSSLYAYVAGGLKSTVIYLLKFRILILTLQFNKSVYVVVLSVLFVYQFIGESVTKTIHIIPTHLQKKWASIVFVYYAHKSLSLLYIF